MATGISIHIGLNRVDPQHYEGWTGDLQACEFDAQDMASLAKQGGYRDPVMLLTADATVANVSDALEAAAGALRTGDILFLTYSGHGGSVPDRNGDEPDRKDETWVLYDRQLVDDELYVMYSQFQPGVRILVLSDSCHSGSVTREIPDFLRPEKLVERFGGTDPAQIERRSRVLPERVSDNVYKAHKDVYDGIQQSVTANDNTEVGASILLISGCQDRQLSADGDRNGLFTATLLGVWNDGAFQGRYRGFHRKILGEMPPDQQPKLSLVGAANPAFMNQRPFTI
ncbi:MAG: caspase family protein [Acidimicrobiia bacterium]